MGGGGEKIIPTILFSAIFLGITILLIGNLSAVLTKQQMNIGGDARMPNPTEVLTADMSLNLYSPVNVSVNATKLGGVNDQQSLKFDLVGQTGVGVMIARNWSPAFFRNFEGIFAGSIEATCIGRAKHDTPGFTPSDFVLVTQSWMGGTLALERRYRYDIITFDELAAAHGSIAANYSIMSSNLRYWVTDFFYWVRNGIDPIADEELWNNHFSVSITTGYNTTGSISATTLIKKLLTFQLPDSWGIPTFMQILIAIPIYTSVIIIAVLIVSYFIP